MIETTWWSRVECPDETNCALPEDRMDEPEDQMDTIELKVHEVVLRVSRQRSAALPSLENRHRLTSELGLTSLDIARVIAVLELELGVDPFTRHAAITDMRTLGDLCQAYRAGLGAPESEPVADVFASSEKRAAARRNVGAASAGERVA